ncbi:MAG: hypothetical protein QXQ94_09870 [Candidatus Bathyarchaeia archaeon]
MLDVLVDVIARSPPAICLALGFVLLFFGSLLGNNGMVNAGWGLVAIGVLLQFGWLLVYIYKE